MGDFFASSNALSVIAIGLNTINTQNYAEKRFGVNNFQFILISLLFILSLGYVLASNC